MKTIFKLVIVFLLGILGGLFANQVLLPYLGQGAVYVTETKEVFIQENTALTEAIEGVQGAVVGVETIIEGSIIKGSGLILTSDGLVVTLADLIPEGGSFSFYIEGEKVDLQVLRRERENNLALVKVEKDNLPTVDFAEYEKTKMGQRVFLLGSLYEGNVVKKEANEGIIKYIDEDFIRTNMFERVSLAGSPLLNIKGEFLGLVIIDSFSRVSAIPVTVIRTFAGF